VRTRRRYGRGALAARLGTGVLAALLLGGCVGQHAVDQNAGGSLRFVQGDGQVRILHTGERPAAPAVTGPTLAGSTYRLAAHRGDVVVVNFWGSWCGPCRAEARDLQRVYATQRSTGVQFVGVDLKDDRDTARAFQQNFGVGYPSIFDRSGRVALQFRATPPNAIPATIIIDRSGRVAALLRRPTTAAELGSIVRAVAQEQQ
jgi:peroxiredoxin